VCGGVVGKVGEKLNFPFKWHVLAHFERAGLEIALIKPKLQQKQQTTTLEWIDSLSTKQYAS